VARKNGIKLLKQKQINDNMDTGSVNVNNISTNDARNLKYSKIPVFDILECTLLKSALSMPIKR
jgi:hypothetical protein